MTREHAIDSLFPNGGTRFIACTYEKWKSGNVVNDVSVCANGDGYIFDDPFLVIREATLDEYLVSLNPVLRRAYLRALDPQETHYYYELERCD